MDQEKNSPFLLGDRTYDFFKKLVQIVLPGFGTFYVTLGQLWGFPRGDEVAGTCLALSVFLGLVLGISSAQYKASGMGYDGEIKIQPQVDGPTQVKFVTKTEDPLAISEKKSATFKVTTETPIASAEVEPGELDSLEVEDEVPLPPRPKKRTAKKPSSK